MEITRISRDETFEILAGPSEIPTPITHRVEHMLNEGTPIVDIERFGEVITRLMTEPPADPAAARLAHFNTMIMLASCSTEMAWQQAGNLYIPRLRRLYQHNQSVLNIHDEFLAGQSADERDRILRPMFAFQDGGKSHAVALALLKDPTNDRPNRDQALQNSRVINNVLNPLPSDILSTDQKAVIKLLVGQTEIGNALRLHQDRNWLLDDAVTLAQEQLNTIRAACPDDYKDVIDRYLITSYMADAGAHTMRARYIEAATEETHYDVLHADRFNEDGTDRRLTLDRLFSEDPADEGVLRLYQPKHLAVMQRLFPAYY